MFQGFVQAAVFTRLDCTKRPWSFQLVFWTTSKLIMRGKNCGFGEVGNHKDDVVNDISGTSTSQCQYRPGLKIQNQIFPHVTLHQAPLKTKPP